MGKGRAALALAATVTAAGLATSGASGTDPSTPPALPGLPAPFLGTAVVGRGGLTAAVDAYGDVVDIRAPGPVGRGVIETSAARQAAGSVSARGMIVPRASFGSGPPLPFWRADSVTQRYLGASNALETVARFGTRRAAVIYAVGGRRLACLTRPRGAVVLSDPGRRASAFLACDNGTARRALRDELESGRRWVARSLPLGGAPRWACRLYRRSLLSLHALTDRRSGAVAAGARESWDYVWPRDAAATALALAASGHRRGARRVARFLLGLDLYAAARFDAGGEPVPGRGREGDAAGWVDAAARAAGLAARPGPQVWRGLPDYQEGSAGEYLGNAIASGASARRIRSSFAAGGQLVREAGAPRSGDDAAAAWAVRPFARPRLFPYVRRTLLRLASTSGRYGITPSREWPNRDPWTAPTAWTAWSLAALGERAAALRLLGELRRAATPTGLLPERVGSRSGLPRSTTPLAWSEAFTVLALRQLWPSAGRRRLSSRR